MMGGAMMPVKMGPFGTYGGMVDYGQQNVQQSLGYQQLNSPGSITKYLVNRDGQLKFEEKQPKEQSMGFIKEYFYKHRELIMGLAIAVILDRYLLGGAFQERLKRIITGLLDKTENALQLEKKS